MRDSALHLEGYYIRQLSVELNERFADKMSFGTFTGYHYHPEKSVKIDPSQFEVKSEIAQKIGDASKWRYELSVRSSGRKDAAPYTFSISLVGYFHLHSGARDQDEKMMVLVGAPSILFAAAREALASASARGPYPAVILPLVSFADDAEEAALKLAKRVQPRVLAKKSGKRGAKGKRAPKQAKK